MPTCLLCRLAAPLAMIYLHNSRHSLVYSARFISEAFIHVLHGKSAPSTLLKNSIWRKIFQLCSLICHMTTTGVASCVKSSSGRPLRTNLLILFIVHCIVQLAMMAYTQCVLLFNLGSCFSECWASLQWWPVYFWRFCSLERKTDHLNVRVNL